MKYASTCLWLTAITLFCSTLANQLLSQETTAERIPVVIAHRGASGYLPEHTEGAKVLAVAQGADYVEQDVVLTRDGVFVVSHDITMDDTTDVAEKFPDRKRTDGKFYFADFDWNELRQLSVHERANPRTHKPVFAERFSGTAGQRILRLEDEILLLQGLNHTLDRNVGLYIELKGAHWHHAHFGQHMGAKLLPLLATFGYDSDRDRCFIQCFEPAELKYLADELRCKLPLIQLVGNRPLGLLPDGTSETGSQPAVIDTLKQELSEVAKFASGIGPAIDLVVVPDAQGQPQSTGLCEAAHELGLLVHPYTVRRDGLPSWAADVDELQRVLLQSVRVDGFFTDFPDLGRAAVDSLHTNLSRFAPRN